jgi:hypothetical protein
LIRESCRRLRKRPPCARTTTARDKRIDGGFGGKHYGMFCNKSIRNYNNRYKLTEESWNDIILDRSGDDQEDDDGRMMHLERRVVLF